MLDFEKNGQKRSDKIDFWLSQPIFRKKINGFWQFSTDFDILLSFFDRLVDFLTINTSNLIENKKIRLKTYRESVHF